MRPAFCTPSSTACPKAGTRFPNRTCTELPDVDVYIHDHGQHIDYPSHYEPGTDTFHSSVHAPPEHQVVPLRAPGGTRLSSTYEAVH